MNSCSCHVHVLVHDSEMGLVAAPRGTRALRSRVIRNDQVLGADLQDGCLHVAGMGVSITRADQEVDRQTRLEIENVHVHAREELVC